MPSYHPNPGIDHHLRALGFLERKDLEVIAQDNRFFANDRVITKPDWVILCHSRKVLYIIDYKSRSSKTGINEYEKWQLLTYSWVVPEYLSMTNNDAPLVPTVQGILFGDGERLNVEYSDRELLQLQDSVIPAIRAYRKKGLLGPSQKISASFLTSYMVDPTLIKLHYSTQEARKRGDLAHTSLFDPMTH